MCTDPPHPRGAAVHAPTQLILPPPHREGRAGAARQEHVQIRCRVRTRRVVNAAYDVERQGGASCHRGGIGTASARDRLRTMQRRRVTAAGHALKPLGAARVRWDAAAVCSGHELQWVGDGHEHEQHQHGSARMPRGGRVEDRGCAHKRKRGSEGRTEEDTHFENNGRIRPCRGRLF